MSRRRHKARPGRMIQTLAGTVHYVDSDYTEADWALIRRTMARCVDPGRRDRVGHVATTDGQHVVTHTISDLG